MSVHITGASRHHLPVTQATFCWLQVLEEIYLLYRGRYFYPVLICAFSFPALVGLAALLTKQHKKVMALMNECRLTPMVQERWVRATSSHRLVPGDVIVLHSGRALCDMVLLRGACLVTEAMLSGEVASKLTCLQTSTCACDEYCTKTECMTWWMYARCARCQPYFCVIL